MAIQQHSRNLLKSFGPVLGWTSMFNRAEVIDKNFQKFVLENRLPEAHSSTHNYDAGLTPEEFMDLFETQIMIRQLDLRARILKDKGECYYTIGSSGHEGNAALGKAFRITDMAFLHYRSCALMIQRAKQLEGSTPLYDAMLSFVASSEDPIAGGRHKVFGSYPLMVPPQTSTIASHLPKAVGAAFSIGKAKSLKIQSVMPEDSVVLCTFGDASINHSTAVGAVNSALWMAHQNIPLPLVFVCEDNGVGISVNTPPGWLETTYGNRENLIYLKADGLNLNDYYLKAQEAAYLARVHKKPVFLHVKVIRLMGHAGSDMESTYRQTELIESIEHQDPLLHSARYALENGYASAEEIVQLYKNIETRIAAVAEVTKTRPKIEDPAIIKEVVTACKFPNQPFNPPSQERFSETFGKEWDRLQQPLHMAKLINMGLHELLLQYPQAVIFGEDVAQKGGVYNVTDGIWKKFGTRRIFNSPLDEQTILGTAIGMAQNGFLPIPEIQFLAYVHNAEDQIRGEAATLAFFSQGQFVNPMIIRIAGLPYQKGFGGHFHNDNSLAIFRDIPGVIVATPSNGADAVKMLRTCAKEAWENGRVIVFVEPIALYMTRDLHEANDKKWSFNYPAANETIKLGEFGTYGEKSKNLIITYGNGVYYSLQAQKKLMDEHKVDTRVVDLRWIAPIDNEKLLAEIKDAKNVVLVDECRKTGSLSEYLCGLILENCKTPPRVKVVAADDCFIPLGKAAASGLPDVKQIMNAVVALAKDKA